MVGRRSWIHRPRISSGYCEAVHPVPSASGPRDLERDWRANFFPLGIAHSIIGGSAWEPTPWRAVQRAAWEAVNKTAA
jgi:hypothetical protein